MQQKLLLFGGNGFVGFRVARKALSRGYKVIIAARSGAPMAGTPLDAFAQRVRMIGGQAAAIEAMREEGEEDYPPLASSQTHHHHNSSSSNGPTSDEIARMVHQVDEESALEFVSIDAAVRSQVFDFFHDHADATSVISCVGKLTRDYEEAREINGDTNTNIAAGVAHPRLLPAVQKMVLVSAEPYHLYAPRTLGSKFLLKGYFHGKRIAERAVLDNLGDKGVVLRPSFIYGTRYIYTPSASVPGGVNTMSLPLGFVGLPLDKLLTAVGGGKLLMPPVSADVVAEAAVRACAWAGTPGKNVHGLLDVYQMRELCSQEDPTVMPRKN